MSWRGKLIGFLIGLFTRRPALMVIGLILGHLYDIGLFGARGAAQPGPPPPRGGAEPEASDPYAILGVARAASNDTVESAYRRLMSEYHPDRVATAAPEIRALAETRARALNQAYDAIKRERGL
jgi:hypothetical protein